jgi:hypothetical protein
MLEGDGVAKLEGDGWPSWLQWLGRCMVTTLAKLEARLLATAALWVSIYNLSKIQDELSYISRGVANTP